MVEVATLTAAVADPHTDADGRRHGRHTSAGENLLGLNGCQLKRLALTAATWGRLLNLSSGDAQCPGQALAVEGAAAQPRDLPEQQPVGLLLVRQLA